MHGPPFGADRDQPLDEIFKIGQDLGQGVSFDSTGKATFTDIAFNGHPSQVAACSCDSVRATRSVTESG
jgi:hypothetical protein